MYLFSEKKISAIFFNVKQRREKIIQQIISFAPRNCDFMWKNFLH